MTFEELKKKKETAGNDLLKSVSGKMPQLRDGKIQGKIYDEKKLNDYLMACREYAICLCEIQWSVENL